MHYRGRVHGGVVVLEPGAALAEGEQVEVRRLTDATEAGPTLYDRLKDVVGTAEGLPEDMAENHDHYIRGAPKRAGE